MLAISQSICHFYKKMFFFSNSKLSYFETSLAIQNKDIFEQKRWLSSKRIREYKAPPCCSRVSFYLQVSFSEV